MFTNESLAEMLLGNWKFDPPSLEMFQYYRISSNAVYPFQYDGKTQMLRFAPQTEKLKSNLLAELEFIAYLRDQGYGVLESVRSAGGAELVEAQTPWGPYYASVFKRVAGKQLSGISLNDHIVYIYGEALGRLHELSSRYTPAQAGRWTHKDVLEWIGGILREFPEEEAARAELKLLTEYFAGVPVTPGNYGLIHYDFELDNVFYSEPAEAISVIDFDDSMYHWYKVDIERALDSLLEEIVPEEQAAQRQYFMDGYRSSYTLPEEGPSLEACRRFANLYGYARVLRSTHERWEHEPEWLTGLRDRLDNGVRAKASRFGEQI